MVPTPNLKVDGVLGRVSIQTIQAFQQSRGLKPDGKVGPITRANLESAQNGISSISTTTTCATGASFDPLTGLPCVSTPISTSTLNISRTLKLTVPRMTGNDIKELQVYLNNNGYNVGTPDGVYGTGTQKVIINFQQSKNLKPDGSVGPVTLSYLKQIAPIIANSSGCLTTGGFNTITGQPCNTTPVTTIIPTVPVIVSGGGSTGGGGGGGGGSSTTDTTKPVITSFVIHTNSSSLVVPIDVFTATDNVLVTGYLLTETSSTPSITSSLWTAIAPTSYTFSTDGAKILYAWARDLKGNISLPSSASITIILSDTQTPVVTAFTVPSTSSSLVVSVTTFTATDATGVTGYLLTESSTTPSAGSGSWTATAPANYTFATAGAKTLYAWAKDAAGNVSTSLNDSVTITLPDTNRPVVTAFVIPATATSLTVPITTFTATDNIGVTGYLLTETSTTPNAGDSGWLASAPTTYTFGSVLGSYKYNFNKLLKYGITDEEVRQLQIYLNNHGYPISIGGAGSLGNETTYFGSLTKQAVMKFQESNKLMSDGIVGQNTRSILNK